jgi:hypothetical protein
MSNEYEPLRVFVPHTLQAMPPEVRTALFGTTPKEVLDAPEPKPVTRPDWIEHLNPWDPPVPGDGRRTDYVTKRFGLSEEEEDFTPSQFAKAEPILARESGLSGPSFVAEPRTFLGDVVDPDDRRVNEILSLPREIWRKGIYYTPPPPTPDELRESSELAKAQKEKASSESIKRSVDSMRKENLKTFIKNRQADGETLESIIEFAAASDRETALLIRELGAQL